MQQAIAQFEQADRPDLVALCIPQLERVLQKLQAWDELAETARKGLELHRIYLNQTRLSQDYGFLARALLEQRQWTAARQAAQQALVELAAEPEALNWLRGLYRLFRAQAERRLGDAETAIGHLTEANAREVSNQGYPKIAIRILQELRELHFERKHYLEAFQAKQERLSIEQQYGLRAFIGAGRLQPQRQAVVTEFQTPIEGMVAPEITAAGRQQDLERLIERVKRRDYQLIVIHGSSGVGKSSLVNAGLVPALKQRPIEARDNVPLVMRVYTQWAQELARLLSQPELGGQESEVKMLGETQDLLVQLRKIDQQNRRVILIFDQFEEFFFVYPKPQDRQPFFKFLAQCLKILSIKIFISLREDYLHYLLECSRLEIMKERGIDILSKQVRYEVGDFSSQDAKKIIESLTKSAHFYLEDSLIEQLVQDLTKEGSGSVRPIELQIVGAQLQSEKIPINTLKQYQALGDSAKTELVNRYLASVVEDCGSENREVAEFILGLLAGDREARPLKTRTELESDLRDLANSLPNLTRQLDLVLKIFVGSGLVFLVPEIPDNRYQLVHDYLADLIRGQQGNKLTKTLAELEETKKDRNRLLRRQRNWAYSGSSVLLICFLFAIVSTVRSTISDTNARLNDLSASSELLFRNGGQYDAVITGIKLGKQLKQSFWGISLFQTWWIYPSTRIRALTAMQQAVFGLKEANSFNGHTDAVNGISISPDGKTIASASTDGTIKLWHLNGQEFLMFKPPVDDKKQDSKNQKSSAGSNKKDTKKPDLSAKKDSDKSGETNSPPSPPAVYKVRYSPDGKLLAVASADNSIRIWGNDGKLIKKLEGHEGAVNDVRFSPDGKMIASASSDKTIKLWSLNGQVLKTIKGHEGIVNCIDFSPDGKLLASGSFDKTVKLWNLDDSKTINKAVALGSVNSVRFSPDGNLLAYGSTNSGGNTVTVWNIKVNTSRTFSGHYSSVSAVNFSPNGKIVSSAGDDNTIKLWDLDGRLLKTLQGHSSGVQDVDFTPDTKQIVSASNDRSIKLWNIDVQELPPSVGHLSAINRVSFSPDSKTIASAGNDSLIRLWNVDGQEQATLRDHTGVVSSVKFSPDGKMIASIAEQVNLWSQTGKLLKTFHVRASKGSKDIFFSPDSSWIAATDGDNAIKLWSLDGKELRILGDASNPISTNALRISPDGKFLLTFSGRTITLWNFNGEQLQRFQGNNEDSSIVDVVFSPDSKLIASASYHLNKEKSDPNNFYAEFVGSARLWNLDGQLIQTMKGDFRDVPKLAFSPDGKILAVEEIRNYEDGANVHLWNINNKSIYTLDAQKSFTPIQFSPDSKLLATVAKNNAIKLWNFQGKELQTLGGNDLGLFGFQFSPDSKLIASIGQGSSFFKLWSISGNLLHTFPESPPQRHSTSVRSVSFSPNGQLVASASYDGTIKLWTNDGHVQRTFLGHGEGVNSVSFSPNGRLIASASIDGTIKLWFLDGKELRTFRGHKAAVKKVRFSPDGKWLVSASEDTTIKLWALDGKEIQTFKGHTDFVNDVNFSPDGKTIASAGGDKQIKLWSMDGKELNSFKGHTDPIDSVSFSPDGKVLASASDDKTIKLWALDGKLLQTLKGHTGSVKSAVFSPNGKMILSGGTDVTMRFWDVDNGNQIQSVVMSDDGWVWDAEWSKAHPQIVSAGGLGKVTFWNIGSPKDLLVASCNKVRNYLVTNSSVDQQNRHLCDDVSEQK
ncbi:MAG: hypothetical protein KME16_02540 [Scytolyngbya sp. HA4215-MV1]|nr:hypothetical protein [Scytolyngbya sp. HA4215-MV1]